MPHVALLRVAYASVPMPGLAWLLWHRWLHKLSVIGLLVTQVSATPAVEIGQLLSSLLNSLWQVFNGE